MNLQLPYLAKYALVCWTDSKVYDPTVPCCITLDGLPAALGRGAILIGREWDIADAISEPLQSNPIRHSDEGDQA